MKTAITLPLRVFPVKVRDERTGEEFPDSITLEKSRLQAAQLVGQTHEDLIYRLYNRRGYHVLEIGKARKVTATEELSALAI